MDGHEAKESGNMYSTLAVRGEMERLSMVKRPKRQQNSVGRWCFLCNESILNFTIVFRVYFLLTRLQVTFIKVHFL